MVKTFTHYKSYRILFVVILFTASHIIAAPARKKIYPPAPITQTITFNNLPSKKYSDADFAPGATASSRLAVSYQSTNTSVATIVNGRIHIVGVGLTTITASQAGNGSYSAATPVGQDLEVTKGDLKIIASARSKAYGAVVPTLTFTATGFKPGENLTGLTTQPVFKAIDNNNNLVTKLSPASNQYRITIDAPATGSVLNNYNVSYQDAALTINKALLRVVSNVTITYGGTIPVTLPITYSGFVNGENSAVLSSVPIGTLANIYSSSTPAGSYPNSTTVAGPASADNYNIIYLAGTFKVNKATLKIAGDNKTKVYGDSSPALTYTITGFVNGESASTLTTQPTFKAVNKADLSPVTNLSPASTSTVKYVITKENLATGPILNNYNVTYTDGTLTINKAPLTITANNVVKTYGTLLSNVTGSTEFTHTALVNGETIGTVNITYSNGYAANAAVNVYNNTVVPSAAAGGTFAPANYNITYLRGGITVNKAPLTIKADNITRAYGAATPVFSFIYTGLIPGETAAVLSVKPTATSAGTKTSPAGTYPINIVPSGAVAKNYAITYDQTPATLTIVKATLTITAQNKSRAYGAANPTFTLAYTGFVNGDNTSVLSAIPTATLSPAVTVNSNAGTYTGAILADATGITANNYIIVTAPGTLTITKAVLTAAVSPNAKTYGAAMPALSVVYIGFKNGQTAANLSTHAAIDPASITVTSSSPVGTYTINTSGESGSVLDNYTVVHNNTFKVNPANLTITATNFPKTYGTALTSATLGTNFTTSATVLGQQVNSVTFTPDAVAAAANSAAGLAYKVTPTAVTGINGFLQSNYRITYRAYNGIVARYPLTVTATGPNKAYGDALSTGPSITNFTAGTAVAGEQVSSVTLTPDAAGASANTPAGNSYVITPSLATGNGGFLESNYEITYVPYSGIVMPVLLTITATGPAKPAGVALTAGVSTTDFSASGAINGEQVTGITLTPDAAGSSAATPTGDPYQVIPSNATGDNGFLASNYNITYNPFNGIVGQQNLSGVTLSDGTFTYNGNPQNLLVTGLPSGASVTYTGNNQTDAGTYSVSAIVFKPGYNDLHLTAQLKIAKAAVSGVTFADNTFLYDGTSKNLVADNLPQGTSVTYINNNDINVGTYAVSAVITGPNYNDLTLNANLIINLGNITGVTLADQSVTYDGTAKSIAVDNLPAGATVTYTGNDQINAGTYTVTALIQKANYNDLTLTAHLTIDKATITGVTFSDQSFTYDGNLKSIAVDNLPSDATVVYTGNDQINAGDYVVNAVVSQQNYNDLPISAHLIIDKATITDLTFDGDSFIYDGTAKSITVDNLPADATVVYTGNGQINAGVYTVTAIVSEPNYNDLALNAQLTINNAAITGVTFADQSFIYDGTAKSIVVDGLPAGATVAYTGNAQVNSGNYQVTAVISQPNYDDLTLNAFITINNATITGVTFIDQAFVYDGTAKSVNVTDLPVGATVTYTGNGQVNAGTYPVIATISQANFDDLALTAYLTVNKAPITGVTFPSNSFTYDGTPKSITVAGLPGGATVTYAGNGQTNAGNYQVNATISQTNYDDLLISSQLIIDKASQNISFASLSSKTYGDDDFSINATSSAGLPVSYSSSNPAVATVDGQGTVHIIGAGSVSITANQTGNSNYSLAPSVSQPLIISPASLTVTVDNATRPYGTANPTFTASYTGFVHGDTQATFTKQPVISTAANANSPLGVYPIIASGLISQNYTPTYTNGMLTITIGDRLLTFNEIQAKNYNDADFDAGATITSGETVIYTSSNPAVATVVNGKIHITGVGTTVITASAPANSNYNGVIPVNQTLIINKAYQVITFNAIPSFDKGTSYDLSTVKSSSGLPVTFTSNDPMIAAVNGQQLTGVRLGTTNITAYQAGDANYYPANPAAQIVNIKDAQGNEILVHQALSPNGDGINDVLYIEGVKDHPENRVTIINRNGVKVYETKNYDNANRAFNGHSNITGSLQDPGTYFYLVEYLVNGQGRHLTGYFVLKY